MRLESCEPTLRQNLSRSPPPGGLTDFFRIDQCPLFRDLGHAIGRSLRPPDTSASISDGQVRACGWKHPNSGSSSRGFLPVARRENAVSPKCAVRDSVMGYFGVKSSNRPAGSTLRRCIWNRYSVSPIAPSISADYYTQTISDFSLCPSGRPIEALLLSY